MGFWICNKCRHQFVRDIKECPDCGSDKGFQFIEKKIAGIPMSVNNVKTNVVVPPPNKPKKKGKK